MLSRKTRGVFLEKTDFHLLAARTAPGDRPWVVEEIREFPASTDLGELRSFAQHRGAGLVHAVASVYPAHRFIRRAAVDARRAKEPAYWAEVLDSQFRINGSQMAIQPLTCESGQAPDLARIPKEVCLCGAPKSELLDFQKALLESGIYPSRLEIGSVHLVGGLIRYLQHKSVPGASLLLEIQGEQAMLNIVTNSALESTRIAASGFNAFYPIVQKELGLKDEESAKKLFFSNNFDFATMAQPLVRKLVRDLQSAIGLHEVQTGQAISQILVPGLPNNLRWIPAALAEALGIKLLDMELDSWVESMGLQRTGDAAATALEPKWFGLLSLMGELGNTGGSHAQ